MYIWTDGTELYHHGILGQKWGKRNGPPYPLDYNNHSKAEKKLNSKQKIDGNSDTVEKKKGLTDKQKKLKAIAIAGGVVAIAAGSYYMYSKLKKDPYGGDFVLEDGREIFRVASGQTELLRDHFYATADRDDKNAYIGMWGKDGGIFKYVKTYLIKGDIKIAGKETCEKAYNELLNNKDFRDSVVDILYSYSDDYDMFIREAPVLRGDDEKPFKIFKEYMQQKGFSGIIDFNDKYGNGLKTKAPIIFFGGNSNFSSKDIHQLTQEEIDKGERIFRRNDLKRSLLSEENLLEYAVTGLYVTVAAELGLYFNKKEERKLNENPK